MGSDELPAGRSGRRRRGVGAGRRAAHRWNRASPSSEPAGLAVAAAWAQATSLLIGNWRFLFAGRSYGELFAAPSPVLHFWSLAIEEQLYVLFPLVVLVTARRRLAPVLAALIAGSVALSFALYRTGGSTDAVYYGTFT